MSQSLLTQGGPTSSPAAPVVPPNRSIVPAPTANEYDLTNIQGDIYPTFPKKAEHFIFFKIKDAATFKQNLAEFIPLITTSEQVLHNLVEIQKARLQNQGLPKRRLVHIEQFAIAFSHAAFAKLGITGDLGDDDFKAGQLEGAEKLGDRPTIDSTEETFDVDWDPVWKNHKVDGVVLAASESYETCDQSVQTVKKIFGSSIRIINIIQGHVRPGPEEGHEHFGFLDGISQPAIRGLIAPHSGQLQCDGGVIIMGHQGDPVAHLRPDWAKDGSLMAFRKLRQYVPEFDKFLIENPIIEGVDTWEEGSALRGAKMVGRWKSGAPIDLAPLKDNPELTKSVDTINNFDYHHPNAGQERCPFSAHTRKTAPRKLHVLQESLESALIMRAAIPYGPEVPDDERDVMATDQDRGLAFVCYQSVLGKGFKFVQQSWANNKTFPPDEETSQPLNPLPGFDPIIGSEVGSKRRRGATGTDPNNLKDELVMPKDFVVARGGEYFWVPSLKALGMLARGEVLGPAANA